MFRSCQVGALQFSWSDAFGRQTRESAVGRFDVGLKPSQLGFRRHERRLRPRQRRDPWLKRRQLAAELGNALSCRVTTLWRRYGVRNDDARDWAAKPVHAFVVAAKVDVFRADDSPAEHVSGLGVKQDERREHRAINRRAASMEQVSAHAHGAAGFHAGHFAHQEKFRLDDCDLRQFCADCRQARLGRPKPALLLSHLAPQSIDGQPLVGELVSQRRLSRDQAPTLRSIFLCGKLNRFGAVVCRTLLRTPHALSGEDASQLSVRASTRGKQREGSGESDVLYVHASLGLFGSPSISIGARPYAVHMDAPHDNLIRQVKRLAKKRGLSMNRLADAAGVARGTLSDVLSKTQSPTLSTLHKLAVALEVPTGRLLLPDEPGPAKAPSTIAQRSKVCAPE